MKGATLGLGTMIGLGLGAVLLIGMLGIIPTVEGQMFPLTETKLPPGTYVVTTQGYWEITAWIAAHPGKTIPASLIVVQGHGQEPQIIIKEKTKTKVVHEEHHSEHKGKEGKWRGDEGGGGWRGHGFTDKDYGHGKKYPVGHSDSQEPTHKDAGDHKSSGGGSSGRVSETAGN